MKTTLYKVGDRVRVRTDLKTGRFYEAESGDPRPYRGATKYCAATRSQTCLAGKIVTIEEVRTSTSGTVFYLVVESVLWWPAGMFDGLAGEDEKIVITRKGSAVTATRYRGGHKFKTGVAKCSPEDTFDLYTGADIALKRLFGKEIAAAVPAKPLMNAKVVCIKTLQGSKLWTMGRVYTVTDGLIRSDTGTVWNKLSPIENLADLNARLANTQFILLVED